MANIGKQIVDVNGKVTQVTNTMTGGKNKYKIATSDRFVPADLYLVPDVLGSTGMPIEYGNTILLNGTPVSTTEHMDKRKEILTSFDDQETIGFVYGLNQSVIDAATSDSSGKTINPDLSTINMGSFISSLDDNEDPTILGFDIIIKEVTSPLFNGSVEDFLIHPDNSGNAELLACLDTISDFKEAFFKYFKSDVNGNAKVHYLKKISGIDALHAENTNSDYGKSFVKYGEDMITLSLSEDVTQNMGYLSSLYKMLSWSRVRGKQKIPANLLRFEADIVITEVRNFNRIVKNDVGLLSSLADHISKYVYTLYDCQFFFGMPHGAELDMGDKNVIAGFDIKFDYKFSTMKFEKYTYDKLSTVGNRRMNIDIINNAYVDINTLEPGDTNNSQINAVGTIDHKRPIKNYNENGLIFSPATKPVVEVDPSDLILNEKLSQKAKIQNAFSKLGEDIVKAAEADAQRATLSQFRLINKTIDNIRSKIPYGSKMSEPTNVYTGTNPSFKGDAINGVRDFVGTSLKSFFDK